MLSTEPLLLEFIAKTCGSFCLQHTRAHAYACASRQILALVFKAEHIYIHTHTRISLRTRTHGLRIRGATHCRQTAWQMCYSNSKLNTTGAPVHTSISNANCRGCNTGWFPVLLVANGILTTKVTRSDAPSSNLNTGTANTKTIAECTYATCTCICMNFHMHALHVCMCVNPHPGPQQTRTDPVGLSHLQGARPTQNWNQYLWV